MIYYPINFLQISASIGLMSGHYKYRLRTYDNGYENNDTTTIYVIEKGFAYDISLAYDIGIGRKNHGCLFGVKFQHSTLGTLTPTGAAGHHLNIGVFVKYAYRNKSSLN